MPGSSSTDLSPDAVLFGRLGERRTDAGIEARLVAELDPKRLDLANHFQQLQTDQGVFSGTYHWGARVDALPAALIPEASKSIDTAYQGRYLAPQLKDALRMLTMSDYPAWKDACRLEAVEEDSILTGVDRERVFLANFQSSVGMIDAYQRQAVEKLVSDQAGGAEWKHVETETEYHEYVDGEKKRLIRRKRYLVLFDAYDQVLGWLCVE